jgi:Ribonuclease G/E
LIAPQVSYFASELKRRKMEISRKKCDSGFVEVKEFQICPRCRGKGILPEFAHVQHGVCFKCWGKKKLEKTFFIL